MNIKDYKWTEKRFGTRFAKILKGLGFSEENTEDIKVTDANGKLKTLVTDSNFKSILAKNGTLTEVTWQELKDKRDAGKLTPGSLYRITDYQCTTTQENTKSAGHQFDIVLLALSENKLAEEGWAMQHANDTYFANSNLSAWKVWYCLDNDTSRFAWADDRLILHQIMISGSPVDYIRTPESDSTIDGVKYYAWLWSSSPKFTLSETPKHGDALYQDFGGMQKTGECDKVFTNGRGVIYRLIDEWNNDVAYDFKNIQFNRTITNGQYDANGAETWCYTFSLINAEDGEGVMDASIRDFAWNNYISAIIDGIRNLPNNSFVGGDVKYNNYLYDCDDITLSNPFSVSLYNTYAKNPDQVNNSSIYIGDKKVLTEE